MLTSVKPFQSSRACPGLVCVRTAHGAARHVRAGPGLGPGSIQRPAAYSGAGGLSTGPPAPRNLSKQPGGTGNRRPNTRREGAGDGNQRGFVAALRHAVKCLIRFLARELGEGELGGETRVRDAMGVQHDVRTGSRRRCRGVVKAGGTCVVRSMHPPQSAAGWTAGHGVLFSGVSAVPYAGHAVFAAGAGPCLMAPPPHPLPVVAARLAAGQAACHGDSRPLAKACRHICNVILLRRRPGVATASQHQHAGGAPAKATAAGVGRGGDEVSCPGPAFWCLHCRLGRCGGAARARKRAPATAWPAGLWTALHHAGP